MHKITFQSDSPADHVCRALDVARKMGFDLERLSVEPTEMKKFCISFTLGNGGTPAVETLLARLALMVGAHDIRHDAMRTEQVRGSC